MSSVINTNMSAIRTHNVYNKNNAQMNAAMTRVATAQKINSARDGASNWAISEKMRERIRANDQANQNVQNDTALLKTAQGGIGNTLDILYTLKERAINSANDSNINSDRSAIVTEVSSLLQQIDDNAAKVKFNGRTLLNGAVDSTAANSSPVSKDLSNVSDPNAVTANAPRGSHAVYNLTSGLYKWNSTDKKVESAASDTKLVDLVTADTKNGQDKYFKADDTVTLTWKENGSDRINSLKIDASTTVKGLFNSLQLATDDSLKLDWVAGNTGLTDNASTINNVNDMNGDQLKSTAAGIYAIGSKDVKITDLALSVTYNDNGTLKSRDTAQEIFTFNPVQQSYGAAEGSNVVYSNVTNHTLTGNAGNDTALYNLKVDGSTVAFTGATAASSKNVTFTLNDKTLTVTTDLTLNQLNEQFKNNGMNVRAYLLEKGQEITYEGTAVTRGASGDAATIYAEHDALYFVGAAGEDIGDLKIQSNGGLAANFLGSSATATDTDADAVKLQKLAADTSTASAATTPELPRGSELTFFVGGEANFGINFAIGKATAENLFDTDIDSFSKMFSTKEGAQSAISTIDNAISKALNEQTRLGAMETRLGYTSDNLTTMNENLEAGNSAIRDADMAKEMTNYMRYSVLAQASQYMLSQAGQNAFSVLNLLQA